ncbi:MAG: hypothetical protein ABEJ87_01570 [Candidatus Nanohalobium sp.]
MSKGLGIKIIGGMTLALLGVSVLLVTFSSNFGGGSGGVFCSTYESVSIVFPGKKSPPPEGCGKSRTIDYKAIEVSSSERLSLRLSNAVLSCWNKYKGYNTSGEFCEGWNIKKLPNPVNESSFTQELKQNGLCPSRIDNSVAEYGSTTCGSKNQIYFGVEKISEGDFIVIEYNTTSSGTQRIEVK